MIENIHCFLVHPAKNEDEPPEISRSKIDASGPLYTMLRGVFERAPQECDIEIVFRHNEAGQQQNDCRDCLVEYVQNPGLDNGLTLAARLQAVTTRRSGLGLLFLMKGQVDGRHVVVISRFPADQGVLAEEHEDELTVKFIERIFMKSSKAYKSAIYGGAALDGTFWSGRAVDRQISGPRELSDYWIREFLSSELSTTSAAGTKRLAVALRDAARSTPDLKIRRELVAAATLLRGQDGQTRTARSFAEGVGLSDSALEALEARYSRPDLMDESFRFDRTEFESHTLYRAVELNTGAILMAEDASFDEAFASEVMDADSKHIRYIAEGSVIDERLKQRK